MARISFRQGIVRTHSTALQFTNGNSAILLDGETLPVWLNYADGPDDDYFWEEATKTDPAWTDLPSTNPYWIYLDIDHITSDRTFGTTVFEPLAQTNEPANPQDDQHWFDTRSSQTVQKVWRSTKWVEKIRLFLAQVDGTLIQPYGEGSQVGIWETVLSGRILYDDENNNNPIKKFDRRGRGKFITSESPIFSQFSNVTGFKIAQSLVEGQAIETIPEYHAVASRGENRKIGLAKNGTSTGSLPGPYTAMGVSTESFVTGEVRTFTTTGYLTDDNFDWSGQEGAKIFVGAEGELITDPPQFGSIQQIGTVVDAHTILVDIQQMITYDNP